jgi:putative pyruvate formate lyase activating enzyme
VDRTAGKTGFCGQTAVIRAACATLHRGEEPPVSGERGSGAVFFTGCTLGCPFCQNIQISGRRHGICPSSGGFSRICLDLQERGAETLNLVTATQFIPSVAEELREAKRAGLSIPVVWNSSGYEKPETLSILDVLVDVYLPDCKTLDPELSGRLFGRTDYPDAAREAIRFMADRGGPLFCERGILTRGSIVRHLSLPGFLSQTREVLEWLRTNSPAARSSRFWSSTSKSAAEPKGRLRAGSAKSNTIRFSSGLTSSE